MEDKVEIKDQAAQRAQVASKMYIYSCEVRIRVLLTVFIMGNKKKYICPPYPNKINPSLSTFSQTVDDTVQVSSYKISPKKIKTSPTRKNISN